MAKNFVNLWFCAKTKPKNPGPKAAPEPGFPKEFRVISKLFLDKVPDVVFNGQEGARGSTNILPIRN